MKLWYLLLLGLTLSGCTASDYLDYLRQPQQLSRAYHACQTKEQSQCDVVYQAWQDYWRYVTEYQISPANYGQRILAIQQQMAALQMELIKAQTQHDDVAQAQYRQSLLQLQQEYQARLAIIYSGRPS